MAIEGPFDILYNRIMAFPDRHIVLTPLVGKAFHVISAAGEGAKQRFRKELVKAGEYVHEADGYEFAITTDTLHHWAKTFAAMKANGVKVPIPATHEGMGDPDKNRGYVTDMFVDDNSLVMTCELIGKDALAAAARSDVSIGVPIDFTDGHGNEYSRPITHVAMVTDPVIPGLGDFIPIAASRTRKEKKVKKYAELVKALELKEEVNDDNVVALVLSHHKAQSEKLVEFTEQVASLETKLKAKPKLAASEDKDKDKGKPIDPVLLSLAADNRGMKLDALVAAGKVTPDVRKELVATFIGDDQKALTLSLQSGGDVFDRVVAAFATNDPVKLAETTRPQTLVLGGVKDNDKDKDVLIDDAKARAKAAVA